MKVIALTVICLLAAGPAALAQEDLAFHFLKMEGKAFFLERVALNGKTVLSGTLISISLPIYVTRYLQDGPNTLEIEYTSDKTEGLVLTIEERKRGRPQRRPVVRFSSAVGETQGRKVRKVVAFTAYPLAPPPVSLGDADRQAILGLVQAYHGGLVARNAGRVARFFDRAIKEDGGIYPEGMELFRRVMASIASALSSAQFKIGPVRLDGLQFVADGQVVLVSRLDRLPLMESEEIEVEEEVTTVVNGREVRQKAKSKVRIAPGRLAFKRYGSEWHFALPFGF